MKTRAGVFVFPARDPRARARALDLALEFRHDSLRPLRAAAPLRGLGFDRLFEAILNGEARAIDGVVIPIPAGGAQSRYSAFPNASNAAVTVATATSAKTLLQVATPSTQDITIISYSISFDGSAAGKPLTVELIQTDVAATVTSLTPQAYSDPNAPASLCVGGTSATGYNASAEGTITASRMLEPPQLVAPTTGIVVQFPLGREPGVPISKFARIRVTGSSGVTPNAGVGLVWEE